MSEVTYCDMSDLPVASCAHCRADLSHTESVAPSLGPAFRAKFDGRCQQDDCEGRINEGDLIRYRDDLIACAGCS